jgi:hypothetical protein
MTVTANRLNQWLLPGTAVFLGRRDTAQAIPSTSLANPSVGNALIWETVALDSLSGWSAGAPTRWTCTVAGWYKATGGVSFASGGGETRTAAWYVNGVLATGGHGQRVPPTAGTVVAVDARELTILLAVNDWLELVPAHDISPVPTNLNTSTGGSRPTIQISYAGQP